MTTEHSHTATTLLAVALLFFTLFQFSQVLLDRGAIAKAKTQVEERIAEADKVLASNQKMLDQMNAIAIGTQRLADAGNANAKEIVAQLGKLGIKINPNYKEDQEKAAAKNAGTPAAPVADAPPADAPAPPAPPAEAPPAPPAQ